MTAVAIYSADPVLRCSLEKLLREDPAMTVVGVADNPSAILRLIEQNHVDAVLADSPPHELLADWRTRHGETRPGAISIRMRRGCDRVLQTALYSMAKSSLRTSPWAKACYQAHVKRGASHAMALRSLSNKWAKILDALLLAGATYDEAKHVTHLKRKNVPWASDLATPEGEAA